MKKLFTLISLLLSMGTANLSAQTTEYDTLIEQLSSLLTECSKHTFKGGTTHGYYDPAAVEAYSAALNAAYGSDGEDLTVEQLQTIITNLQTALDNVSQSVVRIPDGYYRVLNAYDKFPSPMAMYDYYYDGYSCALWYLKEDDYLGMVWRIEQLDDNQVNYTMVNMQTGRHYYKAPTSEAADLTDADDGNTIHFLVRNYTEDGQPAYNLLISGADDSGYNYLHCGGHNGGAGESGYVVGWCSSQDDQLSPSEWYLEPVSDEEVEAMKQQAIIDELKYDMEQLIEEAKSFYEATSGADKGEAGQTLMAAIETAEAIETPSQEDIDSLKAALEAYRSVTVDPTPLTQLLADVQDLAETGVAGTAPGYCSEQGLADLRSAISEANTLLAGTYTAEQIAAAVDQINEAYDRTLNAIDPNQWYTIRVESLYLTASQDSYGSWYIKETEDGTSQYSHWRFIPMADGTYAMQNRQTGQFLITAGTYSYAGQTTKTPSFITPYPLGDGTIQFECNSWEGVFHGYFSSYSNYLISYTDAADYFHMEPVSDTDVDALTTTFSLYRNSAAIRTFPAGLVGVDDGLVAYDVMGCYVDEFGLRLALNEVNFEERIVEPGEPIILMAGDWDQEPITQDDAKISGSIRFGQGVALEPMTKESGLTGIYTDAPVTNVILVSDNALTYTQQEQTVSAFAGYITPTHEVEEGAGEVNVFVPGTPEDFELAIHEALANLTKAGVVYNLNGQIVATRATLRDLRSLGRGIYILNGVRVMVK